MFVLVAGYVNYAARFIIGENQTLLEPCFMLFGWNLKDCLSLQCASNVLRLFACTHVQLVQYTETAPLMPFWLILRSVLDVVLVLLHVLGGSCG
jgi:hypothetical protein